MKKFLVLPLVLVSALMYVPCIYPSGFFIYHQDTKAQGQAGAFTAQADNPSAIYYNPAGMNQLKGTQISVGSRFFRLGTEYKSDLYGGKENLDAKWEAAPSAYITSDLGTEKWAVGLGVFAPYGLSTSWPDDGILRYVATSTSLKMVDINPSVSYQIIPQLSVGAGIDYYNVYSYTSEVETFFLVGTGDTKMDVSGDGWGFNLGALWKPAERHSFGIAYRSKVDVNCNGDLTTKNIPSGIGYPPVLQYNVKTDANLPQIISGGYAFKPIDKLKLEADIYWVDFSIVNRSKIEDKDTGITLSDIDKDWNSAFILAIGGEYLITEKSALRAGYSYQQNAVPEETFNPNVPDSDLNVIALGLGYTIDRLTIDVSYALGLYTKRDIDSSVGGSSIWAFNGSYDSLIHIIGVTAGYKF